MYSILLNESVGSYLHIIIRSTSDPPTTFILHRYHRICYVPTDEELEYRGEHGLDAIHSAYWCMCVSGTTSGTIPALRNNSRFRARKRAK